TLADLGGIHLLELKKFTAERIETEEQRWLQFFKEGEQLDESALPDWMNTDEMRQAMKTLKLFSDKERDYHAYQARQNYLREQRTIQIEREEDHREMERIKQENERIQHDMEQAQQDLERERLEKQAALQREQAALQEKESAQAEIERLKALLAQPKQ
ncbi:MAG: PD-(D/E)XK nuclease family transposase, partial [Candidatus Methylumidiphilus sp.]